MPVSYASTIGQYALLGAVVGGATLYYKPHVVKDLMSKISPPAQPASTPNQPEAGKKKGKKAVKESQTTGSDTAKSKTKKRKITAPGNEAATSTRSDEQKKETPRDTDNDVNNADFAKSLAKAQTGTKLQSSSTQNVPATSRLSTAIEPLETHDAREQHVKSDADDEDSSSNDGSNQQQAEASGRNVSDMLEKPAAGPAVLRLTNVSEPKKKQQAPKKFEEVQTKKQRQRQARKEEQKRMVAESDRLHEQKKQEHLRQARMAAGTSNQIKADRFAASAQNAWQTKPQSSAQQNGTKPTALLDTFENSGASKESVTTQTVSSKPSQNNAAELKANLGTTAAQAAMASGRENGALSEQLSISEEEQMERVREQEQETAWESVQSKKSKKKSRRDDTSSEASFSVSDSQHGHKPVQPVPPRQKTDKTPNTTQDSNNRFASITTAGLANDEWGA